MIDTIETLRAKLEIARKALNAIADCPEQDLARYCAKVDALAVEALVALEALEA